MTLTIGTFCAELAPPWRGEPGENVRDAGEDLRCDGEAQGRHVGDDPVLAPGTSGREGHQVPYFTGRNAFLQYFKH